MSQPIPHVLTAMKAVQARFCTAGLAKSSQNQQQGFNFRGIDQLYNTLSTYLVDADLMIVPHVIEQRSEMHTSKGGGPLMYSIMRVAFTFVSLQDGSTFEVGPFVGEAMDSGDKASNKAMSAAYKYMAIQTYCIPTVGNDDSDADSPELGTKAPAPAPAPKRDTGAKLTPAQHANAMREAKNGTELKRAFALAWKQYENPADPKAHTDAQLKLKEVYDSVMEGLIDRAPIDGPESPQANSPFEE